MISLEARWLTHPEKNMPILCALLQVLFISNNKIADWKQIELLKQLPLLEHVVLTGNPLHEKHVESGGECATRPVLDQRIPSGRIFSRAFLSYRR